MKRLREIDVEAIAGLTAAVVALVLHLLHIADADVLLAIVLVILALILVRDLRREDREHKLLDASTRSFDMLTQVRAAVTPADTVLIGPAHLREESKRFCLDAQGEMSWFNVCLLMFEPEWLFDELLRPAVENPRVTRIQFTLDHRERQRWETVVAPQIARCQGAASVAEPLYVDLDEPVSCIFAARDASGSADVLLSFWGEPFMARAPGRDVPRYIFRVARESDLAARLRELERGYRLGAGGSGPSSTAPVER